MHPAICLPLLEEELQTFQRCKDQSALSESVCVAGTRKGAKDLAIKATALGRERGRLDGATAKGRRVARHVLSLRGAASARWAARWAGRGQAAGRQAGLVEHDTGYY